MQDTETTTLYRPATLDDVDAHAKMHRDQHELGTSKSEALHDKMNTANLEAAAGREPRSTALHYAAEILVQDMMNDVDEGKARVFAAQNEGLLHEAAQREDAARQQAAEQPGIVLPAQHAPAQEAHIVRL
jgi:hypothetical protein